MRTLLLALAALTALPAPAAPQDTLAQRVQACTACHGKEGRAAADGYHPRIAGKPALYLHHQLVNFREGRRRYGVSTGGWVDYARKIVETGADALEINLYDIAANPDLSSVALEEAHIALVRDVCAQVSIPVAVKLSPFYTALPNFARQLVKAGASGLVLFNRFYQPDLDLEELEVVPNLVLSNSNELRLPLRWIAHPVWNCPGRSRSDQRRAHRR